MLPTARRLWDWPASTIAVSTTTLPRVVSEEVGEIVGDHGISTARWMRCHHSWMRCHHSWMRWGAPLDAATSASSPNKTPPSTDACTTPPIPPMHCANHFAGALYIGSTPSVLPTLVITGGSSIVSNSANSTTPDAAGGFAFGPAMWAVRSEGASLLANNTAAYVSSVRSDGSWGGARGLRHRLRPCVPATSASGAVPVRWKVDCVVGRCVGIWGGAMDRARHVHVYCM